MNFVATSTEDPREDPGRTLPFARFDILRCLFVYPSCFSSLPIKAAEIEVGQASKGDQQGNVEVVAIAPGEE
jgi:hypothetical protein